MKDRIQAILNTLQQIKIDATWDNLNYMFGIQQELVRIRDELTEVDVNVPEEDEPDEGMD